MAIINSGSGATGTLTIDADNRAIVNLPTTDIKSGFASITCENDNGIVTGSRSMKSPEVQDDFRLRASLDTYFLSDNFPGANLNSATWTAPVTTMTVTVAAGFVTLNAGLSTASAAVARVQSYRTIPLFGASSTYIEFVANVSQAPVTNNVIEMGVGLATATSTPTDGVFFRINAIGELRGVVNFNGTELQTSSIDVNTYLGVNTSHHYCIAIADDNVRFWIDDVLVGVSARGAAGATQTATQSLPLLFRNYNSSATSAAQVLKVGQVFCSVGGINPSKPHPHIQAGAGLSAYQGQTGGTMGSTASYANSTDPTASAALSNTAALVTGLGGQFRFNAAATATLDGIVTSFQNPAGTAALPGRTLYITGISISTVNTGAAVATTATTLQWSAAFGHTAVSLATGESATAKAPRRIALGIQTWPIAAAIGQQPQLGDIVRTFTTPIVVNPGEFFATVAKFIIGTATASQVIWGTATIDGYFE